MNDFTIGDLGVFIGTIGGVITGILIATFLLSVCGGIIPLV